MKCRKCQKPMTQLSIHRYECVDPECGDQVDMQKHLKKVRKTVKEKMDKAKLN